MASAFNEDHVKPAPAYRLASAACPGRGPVRFNVWDTAGQADGTLSLDTDLRTRRLSTEWHEQIDPQDHLSGLRDGYFIGASLGV